MKKDNLHYSPRKLDSYDKTWNFIISERIAGKTTTIATKIWKAWYHEHRPSIVLRRRIVDITETYILDLQDTINDFLPDKRKVTFQYKKGNIKEGIVDVMVNGRPFIRFMSLSVPKARFKSLRYDDPKYLIMDEFICDSRTEKYLTSEAEIYKELYNTFERFATRHGHRLKAIFAGNPYSLYNPYFAWLKIDITKVKPGAFIVGQDYVLECYQIKPELKEWLKKTNPLYHDEDDEYTKYAFGGQAINDVNIKVESRQPDGYRLKYIFRLNQKYLGVYHKAISRQKIGADFGKYWITLIDYTGDKRKIYAVDFDNLVNNSSLITTDMRALTFRLKDAIANRDVTYGSIEAGYLTQAIYSLL